MQTAVVRQLLTVSENPLVAATEFPRTFLSGIPVSNSNNSLSAQKWSRCSHKNREPLACVGASGS